MLRVAFIGAGGRARSAHYPNVSHLANVRIEAVAELDESRMQEVVKKYDIPRAFNDHRKMLDEVNPDVVYVIMGETFVTKPALDCLNAGKHVFIEKPAGANADETQQLKETAEKNNVYCCVGYQRRYADVTREAMKRVQAKGSVTLAMGEFHKWLNHPGATSTLWNDVCHVVDLVRFMVGSEVIEVHAYQDRHKTDWRNCYNGLIRFANNAVGIVTGNRASGGRYLRAELHGVGVGCYLRLPEQIEIYEDGKGPQTLSGAEVAGKDPNDVASYEGVLSMHQHFIECIQKGEVPCSDVRDVIHTSRLVEQLEGVVNG
jgi:virulence factor